MESCGGGLGGAGRKRRLPQQASKQAPNSASVDWSRRTEVEGSVGPWCPADRSRKVCQKEEMGLVAGRRPCGMCKRERPLDLAMRGSQGPEAPQVSLREAGR